MLTDEQLIQSLRAALENESAGIAPPPGLLATIHAELYSSPAGERSRRRARSGRGRPRPALLAPIAALLVVVVVVAVFIGVRGRVPAGGAGAQGGLTVVYRAEPTPQVPVVTPAAVARAVSLMRRRIAAAIPGGKPGAVVTSVGTKIFVHVSRAPISLRLLSLVGTTARLAFYDWEANALAPSGRTVASLLATQDPMALEISGQGSAPAGSPGAGSMALYDAVMLASKQPYQASNDNARLAAEYFAFGAPGSSACAKAASYYHLTPFPGVHCYLAGPDDNLATVRSAAPPGVSPSQEQVLVVKRGTVVLQAVPASYTHAPTWSDPTAQFFVLRDHVALFGNEVTAPRQSRDPSGSPDVIFGFTSRGAGAFQTLTARLADRGAVVSGFGRDYNQHFAVALDTQLISVPYIDFKTYPAGIRAANGGQISGNFTISSARQLAAELRLGALPVNLKLLAVVTQR